MGVKGLSTTYVLPPLNFLLPGVGNKKFLKQYRYVFQYKDDKKKQKHDNGDKAWFDTEFLKLTL